MSEIEKIRKKIREAHLKDEKDMLASMGKESQISESQRYSIQKRSISLIEDIREDDDPALLELFLAEYGLSTDEGVALMCLAEALMRVPDADTMDELIEDKIAPSSWSNHRGNSDSLLVNASTWGLMLTGKVLDDNYGEGLTSVLHSMVKRLGEPVIRTAVKAAMKELGSQFVLGETIQDAINRGKHLSERGYTYSYDMLGEAALTKADAEKFYHAYENSIQTLGKISNAKTVAENPGISIKLSALHPRYELGQRKRVMSELVDSTLKLTLLAKEANMGLNIDAEEADRLDLSLDIIEAVLSDQRLKGWDGFGVVVQAYGKRASLVIDWLYALAQKYDRKIMVRLVKGAYWDTEIKRVQVEGLSDFPVFTQKSATDCSYIYCAEKLLRMTDRIYPQFATHNANSVAAILELADNETPYEFQRLHGMGEVLHRLVLKLENVRCRIYAPVGPHRDLLAYLVRRLLENGANSSFVNQIVDHSVSAKRIAEDPFVAVKKDFAKDSKILKARDIYGPKRINSRGWDLHNLDDLDAIEKARNTYKNHTWQAGPLMVDKILSDQIITIKNPANPNDLVGTVIQASVEDTQSALNSASNWRSTSQEKRSKILRKAADLYEENFGEFFALLTREAGKTPADAIAELREAVDFLRYYANQAKEVKSLEARGIFTCISPWNFPLAIFTGQIAAALSVGNGVLAKPAETTSLCAHIAVKLLHKAGVPIAVLQLLPGKGSVVGAALTESSAIDGVCFTGSTQTAQYINKTMAEAAPVNAPLIAETGGLNAMIVDSTALPEQAIKDIIASSFQSAGQRCSALRIVYLQKDIAPYFMDMLYGAMDELVVGDPWSYATDVGPVIDQVSQDKINSYIRDAEKDGRLLKQISAPSVGSFVPPTVIKIDGIKNMAEEIFGPVLHVATFDASEIDQIVNDINTSGFGLTFGLHTRIDERVENITSRLNVGNMYVNRNQIGAIVGSQPFGGEGLSGTGPKAGGPNYVPRFVGDARLETDEVKKGDVLSPEVVQKAINDLGVFIPEKLSSIQMPGPTGESNVLSLYSRGIILCLGPSVKAAKEQAKIARENGCFALIIVPDAKGEHAISGFLSRSDLTILAGFDAVACWSNEVDQRDIRRALAKREGSLISLIADKDMAPRCHLERHLCIDTTAAGGNAGLLAMTS